MMQMEEFTLKTRVYKRDDGPDDGSPFGPRGYSRSRPWMVAHIPEDPRETCYESWEDAMAWATMPSAERSAWLEEEARSEGGW